MDEHQFRELIGTERRLKFNRQPGNGGEGGFVYTVLSFICETVDGKVRTREGYRIGEIRTGPFGQVIPSKKFIEKYPQFRNTKMIRTEQGLVFEDVDTPIIAVGEEGDTALASGRAVKAYTAAKESSRNATTKVARVVTQRKKRDSNVAKDGEAASATKAKVTKATTKKTTKATAKKSTKAAAKTAKSAVETKVADVAVKAKATAKKTAAKSSATKAAKTTATKSAKTTKAATKTAAVKATKTTAKTTKVAAKTPASKASAVKTVKRTAKKVDMKTHEKFMAMALEEAKKAEALGEVPVGAVLVTPEGEVVGRGCNRTIVDHDATAHAEVVALRRAGQFLENYRLNDLTMYVTLEPCCMCVMACVHARIKTIVFGAEDPKTGACASVFDLAADDRHNHRLEIVGGILDKECSEILSSFFKTRRAQQKAAKPAAKTVAKKTAKATKTAAKTATKKTTASKKASTAKTTAVKATAAKTTTKKATVAKKATAAKSTAVKATAAKTTKVAAAKKATAAKAPAKAKATAKKTAAKSAVKKASAAKTTKVAAPKAATELKVETAVKSDDKTND